MISVPGRFSFRSSNSVAYFHKIRLKRSVTRFFLFLSIIVLSLSRLSPAQTWTQTWSDDFTGNAGDPPSAANWTYDTGILNVNDEAEYYCAAGSSTPPCDAGNPNAYLDGSGHLVIQALRITSSGDPYSGSWSSARLKSQGLQSFQYGRIESSMSLPIGPGLWPAYWALGTNISSVGWPTSGEIDYMENVPASSGLGPNIIQSTIHGGVSPSNCYCGGNGLGMPYTLPNSGVVTGFHTYGAIWSPNMIQFYVDDPTNIFFVRTASDIPSSQSWDFNHQFFLLLNLAVGGTGSWPGPPDNTTPSPAVMLVDYVRAYTPSAVAGPTMSGSAVNITAGSTGTSTVNLSSASGSGRVYLSCSTNAPKATCSVNSGDTLNPYTVDFSQSASGTATISMTTTPNTAAAGLISMPGPGNPRMLLLVAAIGSLSVAFLLLGGSLRLRFRMATVGLVFAAALLTSCGGSASNQGPTGNPPNGTPPGSYSVTVNSYTVSNTSGNPDTTTMISMTVN